MNTWRHKTAKKIIDPHRHVNAWDNQSWMIADTPECFVCELTEQVKPDVLSWETLSDVQAFLHLSS